MSNFARILHCKRRALRLTIFHPKLGRKGNNIILFCLFVLANVAVAASPLGERNEGSRNSESKTAGTSQQSQKSSGQKTLVPPGFQNIRHEEDWSVLGQAPRSTAYENFKFIPLSESGNVYLSLGGQMRMRGEGWSNFELGGPGNRDAFFGLFRLRFHGDLWLGKRVRVFAEGKSSLATKRDLPGGLRTLDVDTIDLQNALVDIKVSMEPVGLTLRVGRQELALGKQRLVSPLDWANTRRTFDAARAIVQVRSWRLDGFWSKLAPVKKYSFNSSSDSGVDFFGVYAGGTVGLSETGVDLYWLGLEKNVATFDGVTGEERRQTVGSRVGGNFGGSPVDFDSEYSYQFGDHAGRDIRAFMFTSQVAYSFKTARAAPRVFVGLDYASGDDDPEDDEVGTFNQLFPLGHAYLGFIDIVGRQNIVDLSEGVTFAPHRKVQLTGSGHSFWRASSSDALYNPGGGVVRSGESGESKYVGFEVDLTASYRIDRHKVFSGGYSHLFPGSFIKESGPSEAIDFVFVAFQTTF